MSQQSQDPKTIVRITRRLWSEEVGRAEAETLLPPKEPVYQFSNGRRFVEGESVYEPLA